MTPTVPGGKTARSRATTDPATTSDARSDDEAAAPAALPDHYEAARDELAQVVAALEAGGLSLDESLTLWERGQALAAVCEQFLAGARKRVDDALAAAQEAE